MTSNKQIFLNWLKNKDLPSTELDHKQAKDSKLKFDNHAENADLRSFISKDRLESSFKTILKSSY